MGRHTPSSSSRHFGLGSPWVGGAGRLGGCTLGGAEGEDKIRSKFMKPKIGAVSGGMLETGDGGYGHVGASSRSGQAGVEWNSGREVRAWERSR